MKNEIIKAYKNILVYDESSKGYVMKNVWICKCEKDHLFVYTSKDDLNDELIKSTECQICINNREKTDY